MTSPPLILGSRSLRRFELLQGLLGDRVDVEVLPPQNAEEAGFEGLTTWPDIEALLLQIVQQKRDDVRSQLSEYTAAIKPYVLTADTVIVAESGSDAGTPLRALEQPAGDNWANTVHGWFRDHLAGRWHTAATAVCVTNAVGESREQIVKTRVHFRPLDDATIARYIATGEPRGKAGGYGIQGHAAAFVDAIEGSLTNVIGLPVAETEALLQSTGFFRQA